MSFNKKQQRIRIVYNRRLSIVNITLCIRRINIGTI